MFSNFRIIEESREKIKSWKATFQEKEKDWFLAVFFILACLLSYGLGRLSKLEASKAPVTISSPASSFGGVKLASEIPAADNRLVASKKGTKYYFPWCGWKSIREENRRFFATEQEAKSAGYELAGNCKGKP